MNTIDKDLEENATPEELSQEQEPASEQKTSDEQETSTLRQTLSDHARRLGQGILTPIGVLLHRFGVHPDAITIMGFIIVILAGVAIVFDNLQFAGVLLVIALPFDVIDGAVARAMKRTDRFGALLDSTLDRYADAVIFASLGYHFAIQGQLQMLLICFLALIGSFGVSYVRARAESLDVEVKIGLFTRLERNIIILLMLFVPELLAPALIMLAVGTNFTTIQRLLFVYRSLKNREV